MISDPICNENLIATEDTPHRITLLRHRSLRVRKQRVGQPDGTVKKLAAENGKRWDASLVPGETLDDLHAALTSKENVIFVHGAPVPGVNTNGMLRRNDTIREQSNPFQLFDVDGVEVPDLEPAKAAEYVRDTYLAPEFHGAEAFYAASAGHGDKGLARLRLGFATSRKINSAESAAWAKRCPAPAEALDLSIYGPAQPIFIGVDFIGCVDPFEGRRTGRLPGAQRVEVPDNLHAEAARTHARSMIVAPGATPDASHMIEKFCANLYRRDGAAFDVARSRHVLAQLIAKDAGDLGVTEATCDAIVQCFAGGDDDAQADLETWLRDLGVSNAVGVAGQVRRAGEAVRDEWESGADALDALEISRMVAAAYAYRTSPLGCKFEGKDDGDDFAAVDLDDEGDDALLSPRSAFDYWRETGDHTALVKLWADDATRRRAVELATLRFSGGEIMGEPDAHGDLAFIESLVAKAEGAPAKPKASKTPRSFYLAGFDESCDAALVAAVPFLIEGVLDAEAMSVMYGASNTGKTFAALDMAFHIACGLAWNGRRVRRAHVVYIAAEGGRRILARLAVLRAKYSEAATDCRLSLVRSTVDLRSSDADAKALVAAIKAKEATTGHKAGLVIVDTLSRAFGGGNENAPEDMTAFVGHVDTIRARLTAHLMVIHHSGKDAAKGGRGHSSLRAATDTELEVSVEDGGLGRLRVTKQRDLPGGDEWTFTLADLELRPATGDGDNYQPPITSAWVRWDETAAPRASKAKLSPQEKVYLDAAMALIGRGAGLTHAEIVARVNGARTAEGKGPVKTFNANRLRDALAAKGYLSVNGDVVGLIGDDEPTQYDHEKPDEETL